MRRLHPLVRRLPRAALSRVVGWLTRVRLPAPLSRPLLSAYVRATRIDMSEAEKPLRQYSTIEAVFTRRLKPGSRPVQAQFISPVDGRMTAVQQVKTRTLLQIKGLEYSVDELVHGPNNSEAGWTPACAHTCYLSPSNYHRVHAPVSGRLLSIRYIPGDLWPVNPAFVQLVPRLYVQNERLVLRIAPDFGGVIDVVMVGAMNVGRMCSPFIGDNFRTNAACCRTPWIVARDQRLEVGDELGMFMLGSTVVLVTDTVAASRLLMACSGEEHPVKVGQALGAVRTVLV